jgi:hypothetical protein
MPAVNAHAFIDALRQLEERGDVEPMVALFTPDASVSNPLTERVHGGPDGARQFWSGYRSAFKSIRSEFRHVLEDDSSALLEWTSSGAGPAGEIAYAGVSVLEFGPDGLTAFRTYFDPRHVGAQLVAHPKPEGRAGDRG